MTEKQIKQTFQTRIHQYNYCLFSTVKNSLQHGIPQRTIIQQALQLRKYHSNLDILCFVSYVENNTYHTKYELANTVDQILLRKKRDQNSIREFFVEFLCLFRKDRLSFDEVIELLVANTRDLYKNELHNQVHRNLTVIPPNAIMKNGKKYSETHPLNTQHKQTQSLPNVIQKQQSKKTKSQHQQLPRKNESKAQKQQHQKTSQQQKKTKKQQLKNRKLVIQSSQSEDLYVPDQFLSTMQKKPLILQTSPTMQSENHGEFRQKNTQGIKKENQKMEIQDDNNNQKKQNQNHKENSPKETQQGDEEDSMNDFMEQMNKKELENKLNKQSAGTKSVAAGKQTKLGDFVSKFQAPKSVATKQASIFNWMGKKA